MCMNRGDMPKSRAHKGGLRTGKHGWLRCAERLSDRLQKTFKATAAGQGHAPRETVAAAAAAHTKDREGSPCPGWLACGSMDTLSLNTCTTFNSLA